MVCDLWLCVGFILRAFAKTSIYTCALKAVKSQSLREFHSTNRVTPSYIVTLKMSLIHTYFVSLGIVFIEKN